MHESNTDDNRPVNPREHGRPEGGGGQGAHAPWIWMFVKFRYFMASRLFTICVK